MTAYTPEAAERVLKFADQLLGEWQAAAARDSDETKALDGLRRQGEWAFMRPLFGNAPAMFAVIRSARRPMTRLRDLLDMNRDRLTHQADEIRSAISESDDITESMGLTAAKILRPTAVTLPPPAVTIKDEFAARAAALLEEFTAKFGNEVETDAPINGADAVDWIASVYPRAKAILADYARKNGAPGGPG